MLLCESSDSKRKRKQQVRCAVRGAHLIRPGSPSFCCAKYTQLSWGHCATDNTVAMATVAQVAGMREACQYVRRG
jgi:hypothetical protein